MAAVKSPWHDWPQQPPASMMPDLARGTEPFAAAMTWVHLRVLEIVAQALPFAGRVLVEGRARRGLPRDHRFETECMMQPIVHAVYAEWVHTRPQAPQRETLQEFAQFCADCVRNLATTIEQEQNTARKSDERRH